MDATFLVSTLGAVLTLMVFSYLFGNNPLYRIAQHLFVGISIGYAVLLLVGGVMIPEAGYFVSNIGDAGAWLRAGLPILLGVYLLGIRLVRPASPGGGVALNIAVSTAAALAVGGALAGTIIPQMTGTMLPLSGDIGTIVNNLIIIAGVAATLVYFSFGLPAGGQRSPIATWVATGGRWLIVVSLGALLGSLTVTFVAALVERVGALLFFWPS